MYKKGKMGGNRRREFLNLKNAGLNKIKWKLFSRSFMNLYCT